MAKLIYIQGDATQPQRQNPDAKVYLPHCVNSIGAWGSGFVLAINNRWGIGPRTLYKDWNKGMSSTEINDAYPTATVKVITQTRFFVGGVQQIALPDGFVLVNMVGQYGVVSGETERPPIRYGAMAQAMHHLAVSIGAMDAGVQGAEIHCPLFGSGLAGGDAKVIEALILELWADNGINVFVYEWQK